MEPTRFDQLSSSYDNLLKDPLRDRFTGNESLFFHQRKCDLIRRFFRRRSVDTSRLGYLDLGCGKGELATLLRPDFARVAGCDVSSEMMQGISGIETRVQSDALQIPFSDGEFDFLTAVCVYHHVPPQHRHSLTREAVRVLRPGGIFCMIEHNPLNPVTRTIVSRTPVDADAILLRASEARHLAGQAGLQPLALEYFLYFPKSLYRVIGGVENWLSSLPLGGQYATFSRKPGPIA